MANPDAGYCVCPLCKYDRAAIRIAANKKAYVNCDNCVSSIRSLSGIGDKAIRAMMTSAVEGAPAAAPAPAAAAAPAVEAKKPEPAKKKGGMFDDALAVLGGGR